MESWRTTCPSSGAWGICLVRPFAAAAVLALLACNNTEMGGKSSLVNCHSKGITQANLLTQTVKNDTPGEYIEYEISIVDCEGRSMVVKSDSVLFDVNSLTTGGKEPLHFEVRAQQESTDVITEGHMEIVEGRDLFGVEDAKYFHYRTDKQIKFSVPSRSFIFRIAAGDGRQTAMANVGDKEKEAGDQEIETYLRFGDAEPVTKVVTFINP